MTREITNNADMIDSRDVIARIDDLASQQDALVEEYIEAKAESDASGDEHATERLCDAINALSSHWDIMPEEVADGVEALPIKADAFHGDEELFQLRKLAAQAEGYGDWDHGATLIADGYFEEYARQLADDCGTPAPKDQHGETIWPYNCIDWNKAADLLKRDYTEVDFDGETFWIQT